MPEIPLTKGNVAIVDDADFEELSKYKWHDSHGYAKRTVYNGGDPYDVLMHRQIVDAPDGFEVDHINGNRSDNRRSNLRVCTRSENGRNKPGRKGTSRFKGVSWCNYYGKWISRIMADKRVHHVGYFHDEEEAARAWDAKARELHGEFAFQNFAGE